MTIDPLAPPPLLTAGLTGVGGRIKSEPEDFEVEEVPAYEPSGAGEFLYLWVEKRSMGAEYFLRQLARRLDIPAGAIGSAGLKDRHAVTRQWVSVPAHTEPRLGQLDGDGVKVLKVSRHGNKLKSGHLRGNRFRILVRGTADNSSELLPPLLEAIRVNGLPNFYGPQRFGRDGETQPASTAECYHGKSTGRINPFLRKLALSAAQAALFNRYLASRMADGLMGRVLPGDVMMKWPFGGMFVAEDVPAEQARFDTRQIIPAGPMFGKKMYRASGQAHEREQAVLDEAGLTAESFSGFGKLLTGTRRYTLVYVDDLSGTVEPNGVRLEFTLPAGSYATLLLRELTHGEPLESEE